MGENVQNTANPLFGRNAHYIQIQTKSEVQQILSLVNSDTVSSSLQQDFTTQEVYIHVLVISSKTQLAFLIANEYFVHLWSDIQHLYTAMKMARRL